MDFAKRAEALGAGEVVVNSIDRDGADCVHCVQRSLRAVCSVNGEGGAGTVKDIAALIDAFGIIGAAAGSLFVFKGKYRAVLINYPNRADKDALVSQALVPR